MDSRFDDALAAGLKEWYDTDQAVRPPLLSFIRVKTAERGNNRR